MGSFFSAAVSRRTLLRQASAGAALAGTGLSLTNPSWAQSAATELTPGVPSGVLSYATMATLPGKKPLIRLADRGPNYEAPLEYFRTPITPNDEFFVRYHLSNIPEVDAKTYKIAVGGEGANGQTEITLDALKKMPAYEVVAVNQCSGNRVKAGKVTVSGLAWDGGYGIRAVEVSTDDGKTWAQAKVGQDLGRFAFRPWSFDISAKRGKVTVMANAITVIGQTPTATLIFNPAGYHTNVIDRKSIV